MFYRLRMSSRCFLNTTDHNLLISDKILERYMQAFIILESICKNDVPYTGKIISSTQVGPQIEYGNHLLALCITENAKQVRKALRRTSIQKEV